MHVTRRAVQALYIATYFPWLGTTDSVSVAVARKTAARNLAFVSTSSLPSSSSSSSSSITFQQRGGRPIVTNSHRHNFLAKMSSSSVSPPDTQSTTTIQQAKNRVALLQLPVTHSKLQNIATAKEYIERAYNSGAQLCVLPEIWNSPYATSAFEEYAEILPNVGDSIDGEKISQQQSNDWGDSSKFLLDMAKSTNMYIVGGSIPEVVPSNDNNNKIYNTCLVINPSGKVVGKHRKVHLFDVDVPGGICFKESETLTGGDSATYFDVDDDDDSSINEDEGGLGRIGVGIWYV